MSAAASRVAAVPVGEQPAEQARVRQRLGGVPADADHQAEVRGEQQSPQGMPPRLAGEQPAEPGHRRDAEQVDEDQHERQHPPVPAPRQQPRDHRVPDPGIAVRVVDGDAVGGGVPVEGVEGEAVVELPVVPLPLHVRDPGEHQRRVAVPRAGGDEQAELPVRPARQPGDHEDEPASERDQPGELRPVKPGHSSVSAAFVRVGGADKMAGFAISPADTDIGGYGGSPPRKITVLHRGSPSCRYCVTRYGCSAYTVPTVYECKSCAPELLT